NAQKMLRDLTTPILAVYSDTFEPDRRPPTLRVACRSVPEIRLRLYRARLLEAYRDLDPATADYSLPSPFQQKEGPEPWYGEKLAEWEFRPHYRGEFQYQSTNVSLPISRPGTYVVEASGGGLKLRTLVTANTLQFVAVPNGDRVEFFAGDSRTGRALSGVELVVAESWNHSRERAGQAGRRGRVRRVHTNGDGLAAVPWTPLPQHDSHRMWVLAHRSEQYAICTGLEYHAPQPPPSEGEAEIRSYSVTDRFVYRPGQEVHLRHLLFQRERTGWQPAAGKTVHAEIYGPRGGVRLKYQGKTSEFGSFHGSVRLPPEAPLGHYSVSLRDSEDRQTFGSSGFQVEEYRKPEFGVTIEVGAERVRPGQNVAAMVKVRYYSGGAVPQAQVRYRVRRNSWSYVPSPLRPFETRFPTVDFRRQHPGPDIVVEGAAHTDDQGELQIPFSTQPPEDAASRGDYHYTIEADVQGASRQVISGRTDLLVTQRNLFVSLYGDQGYWQLGERVRLELAARNALSRPVSVTGIARVYRRPEFLVQARRVVHTARVTVDQEGRGSLAWTPAESGRYDVEFHAQDGDGQPVVSKHSLWVDGPPPDSNRRRRYQLELHVKSPYYRVGETARVLVVGMAESTVLVYRTVNHRRLESHVVRLPDGRAEVEFPVTDQDAPNTEIHAVALWAGRPEARVELLVPPLERLATVTVRADRARYQPGERARLAVAVRDWQGRPLRTELSVAVADAALDYIATSSAENIQHRLFGERRGFWFRTAFSSELQHFTYEWQRLENPSTPAPIPLFAFLESEFPTRGVWGYASGCGGAAGPGAVVSRGSYGSSLQQAAMARAGPAGVIHPSLGSGAETRTVDPHLVRTRFVDTAYWTPAVVTGADGKATIEFTWPDNLTRWRAVGIGTTREAQLGAGETTMETGKDLQVRLQVPRFTVERDRIALTSVVQNNTDRPRRAAVRLDLQGDAAEPVTGEPLEREVRLPARGETRVDWRLHARREGSLTVRTAAQSETLQDGMELTFPVLVHGAERIGTQSGVVRAEGETELKIELPSARKPGNSEVVVQLSPSMATVMLDALPYLVEYPYGCIEQTVSRFVPAVVTARTLKDLGYDLEALGARAEQLRRRPPADPSREYGASPYSFPAGPLGRTPRADRRRDLQLLPSGLASP
ncbi:MAG: hypothetical protein FJX77_04130, partial [Armatimonadetes bacterium]|nr:hypothetical protein [Armatimonadota bacterium]